VSRASASRPASEPKPLKGLTSEPAAIVDDGEQGVSRLLLFQYVPSWLTSFILHVIVIILLAIVPILVPRKEVVSLVAGNAAPAVEAPAEINLEPLDDFSDVLDTEPANVAEPTVQPEIEAPEITEVAEALSLSDVLLNPSEVGLQMSDDILGAAVTGNSELAGRSKENREKIGRQNGATAGSENAVLIGLKWLADHQLPDGSWNFNHQLGPGKRSSPNPGENEICTIAATSMCLLAFLGNGQTHLEGDYKNTVEKALAYLVEKQQPVTATAGRLMDGDYLGGIYAHGIATIALAEAYAMSDDTRLHDPAQAAINYLEIHQDPNGGGWRYQPKMPGDLSVSGWQLMALKSGLLGELQIPKNVMKKSVRFLDNVSFQSGARYGYQVGNDSPTTSMTAVGLLCRMYTGWKRDNAALQRGVAFLARVGPSMGDNPDLYYDYYAMQVMRQYGGDLWKEWNQQLRDYLVQSQSTDGPTKGSWYFSPGGDNGIRHGGRVYCTALAIMTLEVYYRYMPIYRDRVLEEDFPLD
jgi:hypothetical protein